MQSSGILRRVAFVRIHVSDERIASMIRVTRIGELETELAVTSNRSMRINTKLITILFLSCRPDDGSDMFLRNVGSYKSHTA
jgi:hypothetical protein